MLAKYDGKCRVCKGRIFAGTPITFLADGGKGAIHKRCAPQPKEPPKDRRTGDEK